MAFISFLVPNIFGLFISFSVWVFFALVYFVAFYFIIALDGAIVYSAYIWHKLTNIGTN